MLGGNLCYVALDYDAELSKDTEGSFEVVAEGWFTLSKERFQTGEILFQPRIVGIVSRPTVFKKSMKKFNVAWWAYSLPLTVMALASTEYAQEVKSGIAHGLMLLLSLLSVVVALVLMVFTVLNANMLLPSNDPILSVLPVLPH
ncbi:unnamed protein product [Camellia sinensis]